MTGYVLEHGDCLEVLRTMGSDSVDVVVTDPPYGINFPYAGYDDRRENLVDLIQNIYPLLRKVAKSRVIVLPGPTQIGLWPQADWVGAIIWKTTGSFGKYGFNQWMPVLFYGKDVKGFGSVNGCLKSDVISMSGGFHRSKEEKQHPCPKPLPVMRSIIKRYVEPNSVVLDPFCGSGTTGCAALLESCSFIGIEREQQYLDIARARIKAAADEAAKPRQKVLGEAP